MTLLESAFLGLLVAVGLQVAERELGFGAGILSGVIEDKVCG
jgi:hypothetical protein